MKKRLLACLLTAAMLVSLFPLPALAAEAERPEWMVTVFDPLDGDIAAQTVPQGGEPVLPDSLTAWAYVIEDDTAVIPPPEGLEQESEQPQTDGPEEAEDNQLPVDGQEGPEDEQLPSDNAGEPSTPDVTLVNRTAENTPEPAEEQEPDIQPVTIPGVIWEAQPEFDPDAPGEYVYTPVLPAAYEVAGEVELPAITVNVEAAREPEQTAVERVQALIDALPDPEGITLDNAEDTAAQIWDIDGASETLTEEERAALDFTRYEVVMLTLAALMDDTPTFFTTESNISYLDCDTDGKNWTTKTCSSATVVDSGTTTWSSDWYVVNSNVTIGSRVTVSGDVHLILTDGYTLTVNGGIRVSSNQSLTIYSQEDNTGVLIANGQNLGAGIGGNRATDNADPVRPGPAGETAGTITIFGGNITASSQSGGAGIGGGCGGNNDVAYGGFGGAGGKISIYGGTITATSQAGAGIGGGCGGSKMYNQHGSSEYTILIQGGFITATGGSSTKYPAADIGSGDMTMDEEGTFTTGENGSAVITSGIISGQSEKDNWSGIIFEGNAGQVYGNPTIQNDVEIPSNKCLYIPQGSTLTIPEGVTLKNDGWIIVMGGMVGNPTNSDRVSWYVDNIGAGSITIGDECGDNCQGHWITGNSTSNNITVTGGTHDITLFDICVEVDGKAAFSIENTATVNLTLEGNNTLRSGTNCAGLQVSENGILIVTEESTGSLTATGGSNGAGIGGGNGGAGGTITISGGTVMATGGSYGAGIGGGDGGAGGMITINGGTVMATGTSYGAGIGGGISGAGGTIIISGGTVMATSRYATGIGGGTGGTAAGTFSTGTNGNAFIVASIIKDQNDKSQWSGVIFEKNNGKVYGSPTLKTDATISSDKKLEIPAGNALTIDNGVTLTNEGEITNNGTLTIDSTGKLVVNNGTIINNSNSKGIIGTGTIEGRGTLTDSGTIAPSITNNMIYAPTIRTQPVDKEVSALDAATFTAEAAGNPVPTYQWQVDKGNGWANIPEAKNSNYTISTTSGNMSGWQYRCIATNIEGSAESSTVTLTVNKLTPNVNVSAASGLTYNGSAQALISGGSTTGGELQYSLSENDGYSTDIPTETNAGTYPVWYKVVEDDNYNGTTAQSIAVTIAKATPTPATPSNLTAIYGQTLADVSLPTGWAWDNSSTPVGDIGSHSFPATYTQDSSGNYNTVQKTLSVTVSAIPRTITVTGQANSPTQITLSDAVIDPNGTGGAVSYGKNTTNAAPSTWQPEKEFSGLTADNTYYFFAKVDANGNYAEAVSAGVAISTPAKAVSNIAIASQPTTLDYTSGQTLDLSGLSVTVNYNDGTYDTFEWASGRLTASPAQGTALTVTGHNVKTVTISYGGATAETNVLTVTQGTQAAASITGAPATIYNGDSFTLTLSGGSGTGAVTWEIVSGPATVDATTGKVTVTGTGEIQIKAVKAADTDYTQTEATITLNAVARPSPPTGGGGGGTYTPPYPPTVEKPGEGGGTPTISPSNPKPGDAVTVKPKPDEGYEVDKITVTDKDGKPVEVTVKPDGTYTFKQPSGKVTVKVTYRPTDRPWNNPFTDVSEGDWYYEAVRFVQERGLMNGYSDGRFGPNDNLSRAQLAQILFNKEGRPGVNYLLTFSDVADEVWYTEAIRWAASQGIVSGYGNGTFGPNDPITREQLAVMLWRYSGSPAATNKELHFADADEISPFALEAMRWAVENGILNGYGDGRLGPQGQATRAQVAQMLKNFIENQEEENT